MPHQAALTLVAPVRPGQSESLRELLASMGNGVANGSVVDFGAFTAVHFARFILVEETRDLRGEALQALLIYISDFDVSARKHLSELVEIAGAGIDRLFGHCEGYPDAATLTPEIRLASLHRYLIKEQARYVNTIGRTVRQVRSEAELRERVEGFLDGRPEDDGAGDPVAARAAVQKLAAGDESLRWALEPPEGLGIGFRLKELAHLVGGILLVLILLPLLLLIAPVFLVLLRLHERSDPAPHVRPPPELVRELAALEDHLVQNPFTAIGFVKPGLFRRATLTVVLMAINFTTRHFFNHGNLAGVKTIHFARWVVLDGWRRVIFASNYDGSLESYMDDFIDKISWGLNIVFSNGYGFPRARWLVFDGATDELAFKDFLRLHQVPTRVWYSAYGRLTNANIANNARIRAGLHGDQTAEQTTKWVEAL